MSRLPKKFVDRVGANLKKYQRVATAQQKADGAEAHTIALLVDCRYWIR